MRRTQERYAPTEGYDVGPLARHKYSEMIVRKAGIFPGDWVLDVQTGTGVLGVNVARAFRRAKVVATDHSVENLAHARENAKAEGCADRMAFVACVPDLLPFKDEKFYFATAGFRLCAEEEPLDALDEIHRVTGFSAKIYFAALDLTGLKTKKPEGVHDWVFTDEVVKQMREIGYAKVQRSQIQMLADGAKIFLVLTKRFDAEGEEDDEPDNSEAADAPESHEENET